MLAIFIDNASVAEHNASMENDTSTSGGAPAPETKQELAPQSIGGKARAEKLSPARRTAIARKAAVSRWQGDLPYATHESGDLMIADRRIACAVLNTRVRVLTQETLLTSIGRAAKAKGGTGVIGAVERVDDLPPFLAAENLNPFISDR